MSDDSKSYATPAAILIGSAIIAVGVYLGLSSQQPPAPPAVPSAPAPAAPPRPPEVAGSVEPAPSATGTATVDEVTAAAQKALDEELKPKLLEACWQPAIAKEPTPAEAKWTWDVTFDTNGVEIARGISDVRGKERPDVATCLRSQPLDLRVPPPPANTRVTLELELP